MDAPEALVRARDRFEQVLATIAEPDWERPTPCTDWSVHQVANHVLRCAVLYQMLLGGARSADVLTSLRSIDLPPGDLPGATRTAWAELAAGLQAPGALEGLVHHPAGDLPAAWLAVTAVEELTVHGWDLARATGGDEAIDEEVAAWLAPRIEAMLPALAGLFRPPAAPLPDGAPPSERLLHLTGRAG